MYISNEKDNSYFRNIYNLTYYFSDVRIIKLYLEKNFRGVWVNNNSKLGI